MNLEKKIRPKTVRYTAEDFAYIEKAAHEDGVSTSKWIRDLVVLHVRERRRRDGAL